MQVNLEAVDVNWGSQDSSLHASYIDIGSSDVVYKVWSFPFRFQFGGKICFDHASPN